MHAPESALRTGRCSNLHRGGCAVMLNDAVMLNLVQHPSGWTLNRVQGDVERSGSPLPRLCAAEDVPEGPSEARPDRVHEHGVVVVVVVALEFGGRGVEEA